MSKLVFLDLEGVLVTHRTIMAVSTVPGAPVHYNDSSRNWMKFVDPVGVALIFRLTEEFNADIVLTSTLRYNTNVVDALQYMWLIRNCDTPKGILATGRSSSREEEIQNYISEANKKEEVTRYVVIDDRSLDTSNFVRCDPREGFSYSNFQKARGFLCDDVLQLQPNLVFL